MHKQACCRAQAPSVKTPLLEQLWSSLADEAVTGSRRFTYIDFHVLVQAVAHNEVMGHHEPVRLHGVVMAVVD